MAAPGAGAALAGEPAFELLHRRAPLAALQAHGGAAMIGAARQAEIRASEERCSPADVRVRAPGGTLTISVSSGPPQAFAIGRDVEESFVTPAIPPGGAYTWWVLPPPLGRLPPAAARRRRCSGLLLVQQPPGADAQGGWASG